MADQNANERTGEWIGTNQKTSDLPREEPLPGTDDPGGAHVKGYSADPRPEAKVKADGPVPLAAVPDGESHVQQPERDGKVQPVGRGEPRDYTPNDRLMGSDR